MRFAVTVAIPYYDAQIDYVSTALQSLLEQSAGNWAAFVMDDSPAGSPSVAKLVAEFRDARISYRRNLGPHGIGNAWNACLAEADTPFVSLLHSDDALEPSYLEAMLELTQRQPGAAIYFCDAVIIDERGKPCYSLPDWVKRCLAPATGTQILRSESGVRRLTVGDFIICPTMLYRTASLAGRRFSTRLNFALDYDFVLRSLLNGQTIVGTRRKLYRYRRHSAQWTSAVSTSGARFREELATLAWVEAEARTRGWALVQLLARAKPVFRLNVAYELIRDIHAGRTLRHDKIRYLWSR